MISQLEQLENAQLIRRLQDQDLAYLFKHALTQESAYESLLRAKRREIHRIIAGAYERLYADNLDEFASLLAHHFAQSGNDEKLAEYAIRAGDHARHLSAHPEAETHYALALSTLSRLPDTEEYRRVRIDVIIKRTTVSFASASPEENLASLYTAASLAEELLRADETSRADRLRHAAVQMWIGRMQFYRMERRAALDTFGSVLPAAQELGDKELAALASTVMARSLLWQGEFGHASPLLQQALAPLEQVQNWTEWILANALLGVALAARGEYKDGLAAAERALGRAQELHHLNGISIVYSLIAVIHMMGGAVQQMFDASRAGVEFGLATQNWLPTYSAFGTLAWAASRSGQHDDARRSMLEADAIADKFGGHYLIEDWFAAIKTEMALNAGQLQETLVLAEHAVTLARSVDGKFAEALAQRAWGVAVFALDMTRWEEAETHLMRSWELFESGDSRLEAARTHVAWGKVLAQRGKYGSAREHFEQAAAQFKSSGLTRELEETKHLIDSSHA